MRLVKINIYLPFFNEPNISSKIFKFMGFCVVCALLKLEFMQYLSFYLKNHRVIIFLITIIIQQIPGIKTDDTGINI